MINLGSDSFHLKTVCMNLFSSHLRGTKLKAKRNFIFLRTRPFADSCQGHTSERSDIKLITVKYQGESSIHVHGSAKETNVCFCTHRSGFRRRMYVISKNGSNQGRRALHTTLKFASAGRVRSKLAHRRTWRVRRT